MNEGTIGLKLADGSYYPVLAEGEASRKRLVVTTVRDEQRSVQIDLYRGAARESDSPSYIGSLVIEDIPPLAKGEPDIRLELSLGGEQELRAFAEEASTGASQSLSVSLKALTEEEKYEIPDFELEEEGGAPRAEVSFDDEDFADTDQLPADEAGYIARGETGPGETPPDRRRRRPLAVALMIAAILAALLGAAYLGYRLAFAPAAEPPADSRPVAVQPAPAPVPAAPAPAIQAAPPPTPEPKPAVIPAPAAPKAAAPSSGAWYKIRWGDTLWDLAYAYYRNPWYYPRIAKANKIRNPDRIVSGTTIWIPEL